jgi:DNA-binding GntR family transcriptional regulator
MLAMGTSTDPVYLRVLRDLRHQIRSGLLEPGARVPSRNAIMARYGVGETAAKHTLAVLAAEGLIEARPGSGSFVRPPLSTRCLDHVPPDGTGPAGSPFGLAGRPLAGQHESGRVPPPAAVAGRLGLAPGSLAMRTRYVLRDGGTAVQVAVSYEPAALTAGTPAEWPEAGPLAGRGVTARLAAIGVGVDEVTEEVSVRPALPGEAAVLGLPPGAPVLLVERSHLAGPRVVETADIVTAAGGFRLRYRLPAGPAGVR